MESKKKIIFFLIFIFCFSCNSNYYNEQQKQENKKLIGIKYNLYSDKENNLYLLSKNFIFSSGNNEQIEIKRKGNIIQDSIYDENGKLVALKNIIDIETYLELEKDYIYQDKNNIYMSRGSQYNDYPFHIASFVSKDFSLIPKSNYFRYRDSIYYYGNEGYIVLKKVNSFNFKVDSLKTLQGKYINVGFDGKNIYHNSDKINSEILKMLPINYKSKDSLLIIYFPN
ncbi:hypothetical protein ACM39_18600 [Chryseobacterium sp. FH2]|uniref:hypothetical protein n=1 Tax=Chryseobacterium sp. FH2 TaxID=1674291 RepID=UPI00065ABD15|nr:hypothetical protein [Chryseobacterium sp. FH2]KMQ58400.1 hypothetical protein ACM39_18600 [Chryseobacterium sp. FH2]